MGQVGESLAIAAALAPEVEIHWHWRFDLARQHVGGQKLKNDMLDAIEDGWVWVLDDDTLAYEEVLRRVVPHLRLRDTQAVVVSQLRSSGRVLEAAPEHAHPGAIDVGQAFLRRELIGAARIPEEYDGDGWWLLELLRDARVTWVPEVLSLHNALSGVEVRI